MTLPMAVLGRTGLDVTRLGYGAAHHRPMSDDEARAVHAAVLESGINFIDTSDDYGNSEELIGTLPVAPALGPPPGNQVRYAAGRRRPPVDAGEYPADAGAESPEAQDRLRGRDAASQRDRRGVRAGRSRRRPRGDATAGQRSGGSGPPPRCRTFLLSSAGACSTPSRFPTRRWSASTRSGSPSPPRPGSASSSVAASPVESLERARAAKTAGGGSSRRGWTICARRDETRSSLLLRYTLTHPHSDTIIVGTTNPAHVAENARTVLRGPLSPDTYQEIKRRMDAAGESPAPAA